MLDPNIILQGRPAQIQSPIESVGQLMALRGQQQQMAVRQQQIETQKAQQAEYQAQADERNRDLADQNTIQEWSKDPANAKELGQGNLAGIQGKVQPKTIEGLQKTINESIDKHLTQGKSKLELTGTRAAQLGQSLDGLLQLPDDASRAQAWHGMVEQSRAQGLLDDIPPAAIPASISGKPEEIKQMSAQIGLLHGLTLAALARDKDKADTASKQSTADLNAAKLPGEVATGEREQLKTNAMKAALSNPQSANTSIDGIIDPAKHPNENKAAKVAYAQALATTGDPEKALQEVNNVARPIREQDAQIDPAVLRAKLQQHVNEAAAVSPIELARTVAAAKLLRGGDNPAVQHVAPADISRVTASAQKLDQQAIAAKSATESLGRVLDLAEGGNTAAGHNVPLVSVGSLNAINHIKRMNSAEITSNSNLGSLYDRVVGKIQNLTEGQPIPADVLSDIRELHESLGQQGYQEYTQGLDALNQRSQSQFKPVVEPPNIRKVGGAVAPIKLKGGRTLTPHTVADAERFRKDHPDLIEQ